MALASAVPVRLRSKTLSVVTGGVLIVPVSVRLLKLSVPAVGATVSTVTLKAEEVSILVPSVETAVKLCKPSASAVLGPKPHIPLLLAVTVPSVVPPSFTVTNMPASAVPLIIRVLSLVI